MGRACVTGDPDETYGGIRVADVVLAIRDLEPGFHSVLEVRARFQALTGTPDGPALHNVTKIVTWFGLTPYQRGGEKGWTIDPGRLAPRWPRLPWSE